MTEIDSAYGPQLMGHGATDLARQLARLVSGLLLAGLCRAVRLLKAVVSPPCVASQLSADRPLIEPQYLADLGLGLARFLQGVELTAIFIRDPTIRPHS